MSVWRWEQEIRKLKYEIECLTGVNASLKTQVNGLTMVNAALQADIVTLNEDAARLLEQRAYDQAAIHNLQNTAQNMISSYLELDAQRRSEGPRTVAPLDEYTITGRGQCVSVIQPDPPHYLGEIVLVPMQIRGIECFKSIDGDKPGKNIGLLIKPWTEADK